jgi:GxxExxY protein
MRHVLLLLLLTTMSWSRILQRELASRPIMETIRRSAEVVMARHRSGGTEAMYRRSLEVEMYYKGICCLSEVDCYMMSGSVPIRVGQLDLEVDHRVILELKVAPKVLTKHLQQLRKYVRARASTGMHVEAAAVVCFTDKDRVEIVELDLPTTTSLYFRPRRIEEGNSTGVQ